MSQRIMFLRNNYGGSSVDPIGCVAIELTGVTPSAKPSRDIRYQLSVLNPADKFNRPLARQLAKGRLVEKPFLISGVPAKINIHEITELVMGDIVTNKTVPNRARRGAARWLGYSTVKECIDDMDLGE